MPGPSATPEAGAPKLPFQGGGMARPGEAAQGAGAKAAGQGGAAQGAGVGGAVKPAGQGAGAQGQGPGGAQGAAKPPAVGAAPKPAGQGGAAQPAGQGAAQPAGSGGAAQTAGQGGAANPAGQARAAQPAGQPAAQLAGSGGAARPAGHGGAAQPAGQGGAAQPAKQGGPAQPAGAGGAAKPAGQVAAQPAGAGAAPKPAAPGAGAQAAPAAPGGAGAAKPATGAGQPGAGAPGKPAAAAGPAARPAAPAKGAAGVAGAAAAKAAEANLPPVRPTASHARFERRHRMIGLSFVLMVVVPMIVAAVYLWTFAKDQYASYLGFSVRSESAAAPLELLGGLAGLSHSSTSDPDVLYKFINSRDLVQRIDTKLDLRAIWSKVSGDPVFAYHGDHTVEDLLDHWQRKVDVYFDSGMIDIRVLAFDPADAQAIAQAIFEESSAMINDLNAIAREDAIRYSREELEKAVERLKTARQAMTEFRDKHQLVDPTADVQGQLGVLTLLQQQLAEALVNRGILKSNNARSDDPRVLQVDARIKVIEDQIEQERNKFGGGESGDQLSSVVGEYERLAVDRQFAETTYTAALAGYDVAQAEAQRKSRYLAAYVKPTLAQTAEFPQRLTIFATLAFFVVLLWGIGVLIYYSIRNRR